MARSREYDDLMKVVESARASLGDTLDTCDSLLRQADDMLARIDVVIEELEHRTNGHPT